MIDSFSGEYEYLSNFHRVDIKHFGIVYPSVENAYQASKTEDVVLKQMFVNVTAGQSKKLGRTIVLRPDWENIKIDVMRNLIRRKFQDVNLRKLLLATGDNVLVEGNLWGDRFWGVCKSVGENWLGRILMEERDEIKRSVQ